MSSHHIVREKQEPALLVLGLDNFPDESLGQLLEWSPTVIATANTADHLMSREIKVDWIITTNSAEVSQSDVKCLLAVDGNLTQIALIFLAENGYPAVNIVMDDLDLKDFQPFIGQINLVIFNNQQRIYPVSSGFSKWKPAGEVIKLLNDSNSLVTEGLDKTDKPDYKTIRDGFFRLKFDDPFLFVAEGI